MIKKIVFFHIYFFLSNLRYFKNSNIEIVKNNNPIILELGQIANDLKVGERKIENDKIKSKFLSI